MIRVLFWLLIFYLAWKVFKVFQNTLQEPQNNKISGNEENPHLDIDAEDIEDADFKDIKE